MGYLSRNGFTASVVLFFNVVGVAQNPDILDQVSVVALSLFVGHVSANADVTMERKPNRAYLAETSIPRIALFAQLL